MNSFFAHLFGNNTPSDPGYDKTWKVATEAARDAAEGLFDSIAKGMADIGDRPTADAERVFAVIVAANLALHQIRMAILHAATKQNDTATLDMLKSIEATFAMTEEERKAEFQRRRGQ